jgi:hypothetical protein
LGLGFSGERVFFFLFNKDTEKRRRLFGVCAIVAVVEGIQEAQQRRVRFQRRRIQWTDSAAPQNAIKRNEVFARKDKQKVQ